MSYSEHVIEEEQFDRLLDGLQFTPTPWPPPVTGEGSIACAVPDVLLVLGAALAACLVCLGLTMLTVRVGRR